MLIIGVDYHPSDQYTAFADTETGECGERKLNHRDGAAEKFYRSLQSRAASGGGGWKPPDIPACSSGFWQSWGSNCGSETPRRLRPDESASKRPIPTTPDFCSSCYWKTTSRGAGSLG